MTKDKPVNRDGFNRYRAMELGIALAYYHGSYTRAGWNMLLHGIRMGIHGFYWNAVFRFCDKIGWTRLQAIPNTPIFERHSAKCDRMNCVSSGIPTWFQKLTRFHDNES